MKLKWRVSEVPTGRWSSFDRRAWPSADFENGGAAVQLICEDEYSARIVKSGEHAPIVIHIADWNQPIGCKHGAFVWRKLKARAATLKDAKDLASAFFDRHPEMVSKKGGA